METQTLIRLIVGLTMTAIVAVLALKRIAWLTKLISSGQPTADERGRKNNLGERIGNQVKEVFGQTKLLTLVEHGQQRAAQSPAEAAPCSAAHLAEQRQRDPHRRVIVERTRLAELVERGIRCLAKQVGESAAQPGEAESGLAQPGRAQRHCPANHRDRAQCGQQSTAFQLYLQFVHVRPLRFSGTQGRTVAAGQQAATARWRPAETIVFPAGRYGSGDLHCCQPFSLL